MKVWILSLVAIIAGLLCGIGSVWSEFAGATQQFEPNNLPIGRTHSPGDAIDPDVAPQALFVDGTQFEFGTGPRGGEMEHEFTVANMGASPLTLELGTTSCKCTFGDLEDNKLQPGQATTVKLSWKLTTTGTDFRQTADVLTNDPQQRTIVLEVYGKVTDLVRADPADLVLSHVSVANGATGSFDVYAFEVEDFEILKHDFTDRSTAESFELSFAKLPASELPNISRITSGIKVTVTVKPGLPLGAINQSVKIFTSVADAPDLIVPIRGTVTGDISVAGTMTIDGSQRVLDIGNVDRNEGAKAVARILVKGPLRNEVKLRIASIDPDDMLVVSLDQPLTPKEGTVSIYTLRVEIPPGTRAVNHLGSEQGKMGEVVISTTHPDVPTIPIYVRFAVK